MPFAPFLPRSYCTYVGNPRVPIAAIIRVVPPPKSLSSRPVTSCRCVLKLLVKHGPDQLVPPSYEKYRPVFVPATTLLPLLGSTRTLPTALYCGNWPAGSGRPGPNTLDPSSVQLVPALVDLSMPWLPMEKEPKFRSPVPA